jgi:hypothetical protein
LLHWELLLLLLYLLRLQTLLHGLRLPHCLLLLLLLLLLLCLQHLLQGLGNCQVLLLRILLC